MATVAVRGAVQIAEDEAHAVREGVIALVAELFESNDLREEDTIAIHFTQTDDIVSENPARALRSTGFVNTPLFCAAEPNYPGSLPRMVRVLLYVERPDRDPLRPAYLGGARMLRPDLFDG